MRIAPEAPTPNWDFFLNALESSDPDYQWYYDTVTGDVCLTGPFDEAEEVRERIAVEPGRYLLIDPLRSREKYLWMERFTLDEVAEGRLRDRLLVALDGRGCFRRFKNVLLDAPAERERWFGYEAARMHQALEWWFEERDLAVGSLPPWQGGAPAANLGAAG